MTEKVQSEAVLSFFQMISLGQITEMDTFSLVPVRMKEQFILNPSTSISPFPSSPSFPLLSLFLPCLFPRPLPCLLSLSLPPLPSVEKAIFLFLMRSIVESERRHAWTSIVIRKNQCRHQKYKMVL